VENPLAHDLRVTGLKNNGEGLTLDSLRLYNDGLHGDASAGDSIWGARTLAPDTEGTFSVCAWTEDLTEGPSRRRSDARRFSTAGPVVLDSVAFVRDLSSGSCTVTPYVRNLGTSAPFDGLSVRLRCTDPWVTGQNPEQYIFGAIPAGARVNSPGAFELYCDAFPDSATLHFEFRFDGHAFGESDFTVDVEPGAGEGKSLPTAYALEQNYPNPFNPRTGIRYQVPGVSDVKLVVYDILGREVGVLVNERKQPGSYEVSFDGSYLASGVYIYRLTAGSFRQSQKMILAK
jgi:hypothetical protein